MSSLCLIQCTPSLVSHQPTSLPNMHPLHPPFNFHSRDTKPLPQMLLFMAWSRAWVQRESAWMEFTTVQTPH